MGLSSAMHTALSGISAAQTAIAVTANNLANAQTPGFKASRPVYATQTPQTVKTGRGPSNDSGGANPVQVGGGVQVVGVEVDFSQGAIAVDDRPALLALEGEGLFILEGKQGERVYTRDGQFHLNGAGELVNSAGLRVLGYRADGNYNLQTSELAPLQIPLGAQAADAAGNAVQLTGYSIGRDGRINGKFNDGTSRLLGQIRIARFANPGGLVQRGGNQFAAGPNSGLPLHSNPGEGGAASIVSGAVELSNTDIGQSMVDLNLASLQFRANAAVIHTADALLEDLINLAR